MQHYAPISTWTPTIGKICFCLLLCCQPGCSKENSEPKGGLKLGKTMTQTSMSSSSTSSASEGAAFSTERAVLMAEDSHELTRRIARLLGEKLKASGVFESVELPNSGENRAAGSRGPDIFIRVGLGRLESRGIINTTTKVNFRGACGSTPWSSHYSSITESTPPLVSHYWSGTADVESTFTGLQTDKYGEMAQSIAEQFATAISNQVSKLSRKYPAVPQLPSAFYGAYQSPPDFEFLKEAKARRAISYYGLLTHNETFWRFEINKDPAPRLEKAIAQLERQGWKTDQKGLSIPQGYMVRMEKEDAELDIFADPSDGESYTSASTKSQTNFCAHYRQLFTRGERHAALELLFRERTPSDKLLLFHGMLSPDQRRRFLELVDKGPGNSPGPMIWRAEQYLAAKETNAALDMLVRAKALAVTREDKEAEEKIQEVADKVSRKKEVKLTITPEICRELGMQELKDENGNLEAKRSLGEPWTVFHAGESGVEITSFMLKPARNGAYPWRLVQWQGGSKSSASGSLDAKQGELKHTFTDDATTITFMGKPSADRKQFDLKIRYKKRNQAAPNVN